LRVFERASAAKTGPSRVLAYSLKRITSFLRAAELIQELTLENAVNLKPTTIQKALL
jgi:hypothetical protein